MASHNPVQIHFSTELAFDVQDNINASTRGDYKGIMHGLMRPLLKWETIKIN